MSVRSSCAGFGFASLLDVFDILISMMISEVLLSESSDCFDDL